MGYAANNKKTLTETAENFISMKVDMYGNPTTVPKPAFVLTPFFGVFSKKFKEKMELFYDKNK